MDIERKRRELIEIKRSLFKERKEFSIPREETYDVVDMASEDRMLQIQGISEDMKTRIIQKIDTALQKIEEGTYGICERCGGDIGEERLEEIPFAIYCVSCQEIIDEEEKVLELKGIEEEVSKPSLKLSEEIEIEEIEEETEETEETEEAKEYVEEEIEEKLPEEEEKEISKEEERRIKREIEEEMEEEKMAEEGEIIAEKKKRGRPPKKQVLKMEEKEKELKIEEKIKEEKEKKVRIDEKEKIKKPKEKKEKRKREKEGKKSEIKEKSRKGKNKEKKKGGKKK